MTKFLLEVDKNTKEAILPFEEESKTNDQITAGVSMFYFEETTPYMKY